MATLGQWWRNAQQRLISRGLAPAPRESREILQHVLQLNELSLVQHESTEIDAATLARLESLLAKRLTGQPLAHVLGGTWFAGRWWRVSANVLIPRPDSETLVQAVLDLLPVNATGTIVEVGIGSGALLGTILLESPTLHGIGTDLSPLAVLQASENLAAHNLHTRIELRTGSLLSPVSEQPVELIFSNPPYVSDAEWTALESGVRDHEPKLALVGSHSNPDGLTIYRDLLPQAWSKLRTGGALVVEIGWQQAAAVRDLFKESNAWHDITVLKDLAGRDRVVAASRR